MTSLGLEGAGKPIGDILWHEVGGVIVKSGKVTLHTLLA